MANRIREIRKHLNLSQVELAELINCAPQQISFLEKGDRGLDVEWMERIAKALNIEVWELLIDKDKVISDSDRQILSKYKELTPDLKTAVDAILFGASRIKST